MASKKARIITITSVKGGVGKSTIALSLAGLLAKRELKTIIVDFDISSGTVAPSLNLEVKEDIYTLVDDMANTRYESIEKYVLKYNDYIDVLAAPTDPRIALKIYPEYVDAILKNLEFKYDVILIDTNHVTSDVNLITFDSSSTILYVLTDDLMGLAKAKTMMSICEDMRLNKCISLLNESLTRNHSDFEIRTVLGKDVDYTLPKSYFENNLEKYLMNGEIYIKEGKSKEVLESILDKALN